MGVAEFQIGILGGGQLARMSVMAAQRMGVSVCSLDTDPASPAAQVGPALIGPISDAASIARLMGVCEKITLENEFIPGELLREACALAAFNERNVVPGIDTISTIQDKLNQRRAFADHGVPSPIARPVEGGHS